MSIRNFNGRVFWGIVAEGTDVALFAWGTFFEHAASNDTTITKRIFFKIPLFPLGYEAVKEQIANLSIGYHRKISLSTFIIHDERKRGGCAELSSAGRRSRPVFLSIS
jgi:hypothetical protein